MGTVCALHQHLLMTHLMIYCRGGRFLSGLSPHPSRGLCMRAAEATAPTDLPSTSAPSTGVCYGRTCYFPSFFLATRIKRAPWRSGAYLRCLSNLSNSFYQAAARTTPASVELPLAFSSAQVYNSIPAPPCAATSTLWSEEIWGGRQDITKQIFCNRSLNMKSVKARTTTVMCFRSGLFG